MILMCYIGMQKVSSLERRACTYLHTYVAEKVRQSNQRARKEKLFEKLECVSHRHSRRFFFIHISLLHFLALFN